MSRSPRSTSTSPTRLLSRGWRSSTVEAGGPRGRRPLAVAQTWGALSDVSLFGARHRILSPWNPGSAREEQSKGGGRGEGGAGEEGGGRAGPVPKQARGEAGGEQRRAAREVEEAEGG